MTFCVFMINYFRIVSAIHGCNTLTEVFTLLSRKGQFLFLLFILLIQSKKIPFPLHCCALLGSSPLQYKYFCLTLQVFYFPFIHLILLDVVLCTSIYLSSFAYFFFTSPIIRIGLSSNPIAQCVFKEHIAQCVFGYNLKNM